MRTPTRTDLVEDHQRQIEAKRIKAMDLTTAARYYGSLADSIDAIPAEGGELFVQAREDLASVAHARRQQCVTQAEALTAEADRMESEGYRG